MANYFTLGAALPLLKQGEYRSNDMTSKEFLELLSKELTSKDRQQLELILLRNDNHILMQLLKGDELSLIVSEYLVLGKEKLQYLIEAIQAKVNCESGPYSTERLNLPKVNKKEYPKYMIDFVEMYLSDKKNGTERSYFYEDILFMEYVKYVQKKGNHFLKSWFALEQDVASILAAITAEKYSLDTSKYLVGDKPLYDILRNGEWSQVNYVDEAELVKKVRTISEEEHLAIRERRLDAMKWELLDDVTFADIFSINAMMVYLLKLQILERWARLDKLQGEQKFRSIVHGLNNEGSDELEKYKASVNIRKKSRK